MDVKLCKEAADRYWDEHGHDSADALKQYQKKCISALVAAQKPGANRQILSERLRTNKIAHIGSSLISEMQELFDVVYDPATYCASVHTPVEAAQMLTENLKDQLKNHSLLVAFNPLLDRDIAITIRPAINLLVEEFVRHAQGAGIEKSYNPLSDVDHTWRDKQFLAAFNEAANALPRAFVEHHLRHQIELNHRPLPRAFVVGGAGYQGLTQPPPELGRGGDKS